MRASTRLMVSTRAWGMAAAVAVGLLVSLQAKAQSPGEALEALFNDRDQPGMAEKNAAAVEAALKANPNDYGVLWRAARWHCWTADTWAPKQNPKREPEAKQCWDLGAQAVKVNPEGLEGNYYAGNGVGEWSDEVGIIKALTQGLESTFNGYVDKALKLNPNFHDCDPLILKGRYFWALPWPKRNLGKSAELLRKGIAACPTRVRLYAYLGDTLLKDGKAVEAKDVLEKGKAVAGNPDGPEYRRGESLVAETMKRVEEELK